MIDIIPSKPENRDGALFSLSNDCAEGSSAGANMSGSLIGSLAAGRTSLVRTLFFRFTFTTFLCSKMSSR